MLLLSLPAYSLEEYTIGNFQNMEIQEIFSILNTQETEIKTQKDFEVYYLNLLTFINMSVNGNDTDNYPQGIKKVDCGYNSWEYLIDYEYLYKYNKILSQAWKDYLILNIKEYQQINKNKAVPTGYHYEGISYDISLIPEFISTRREFINKYPDFPLNNLNEKEIKYLLRDLIDDKWQVWENNKVKHSTQIVYKKALIDFDKTTYEYKTLKTWYDVLSKNDFIACEEIYKYAFEGWVWFITSQD